MLRSTLTGRFSPLSSKNFRSTKEGSKGLFRVCTPPFSSRWFRERYRTTGSGVTPESWTFTPTDSIPVMMARFIIRDVLLRPHLDVRLDHRVGPDRAMIADHRALGEEGTPPDHAVRPDDVLEKTRPLAERCS